MAIDYNDNIRINAAKNLDDSKGVFENGTWRPYNSISEIFEKVDFPYESQVFPVRNNNVIETWQLTGGTGIEHLKRIDSDNKIPLAQKDAIGGVPSIEQVALRMTKADLNALSGPVKSRTIYTIDIPGIWNLTEDDTTTIENGGTIIRDNDGRLWVRDYNSAVYAEWFRQENDTEEMYINRCLSFRFPHVVFPENRDIFVTGNSITLRTGTRIVDGNGCRLYTDEANVAKSNVSMINSAFDIVYSNSATAALTVTKGDTQITLPANNATGPYKRDPLPGDTIRITSTKIRSTPGNYFYGQWACIVKFEDNIIHLDIPILDTFTVNTIVIYGKQEIELRNLELDLSNFQNVASGGMFGITIAGAARGNIHDIRAYGNDYAMVCFNLTGLNFNIHHNDIRNFTNIQGYGAGATGRVGYGIALSGNNIYVHNNYIFNCKHAITHADRNTWSLNSNIHNNTIVELPVNEIIPAQSQRTRYWGSIDAHNCVFDYFNVYQNKVYFSSWAISLRNGRGIIKDNVLININPENARTALFLDEANEWNVVIKNNELYQANTGRGFLSFLNAGDFNNIKRLEISDNYVEGGAYFLYLLTTDASFNRSDLNNFYLINNRTTNVDCLVNIDLYSGLNISNFLIKDNYSIGDTSIKITTTAGTTINSTVRKLVVDSNSIKNIYFDGKNVLNGNGCLIKNNEIEAISIFNKPAFFQVMDNSVTTYDSKTEQKLKIVQSVQMPLKSDFMADEAPGSFIISASRAKFRDSTGQTKNIANLSDLDRPARAAELTYSSVGTDANTWTKVASVKMLNNGQDFNLLLNFSVRGGARRGNVLAEFYGRQTTEGVATQLSAEVIYLSGSNVNLFDKNSFKITNNGWNEDFIIYAKKVKAGGGVYVYEIAGDVSVVGTVTYFSNQGWSPEEPSGIYQAVSAGIYFNSSETDNRYAGAIINPAITDMQSSASLNTLYPSAIPRTMILAPNIGSGTLFIKSSDTSWISFNGFAI